MLSGNLKNRGHSFKKNKNFVMKKTAIHPQVKVTSLVLGIEQFHSVAMQLTVEF